MNLKYGRRERDQSKMGTGVVGESKHIEYSTPLGIVNPLIKEFEITRDVCASEENYKAPDYWTKEEDALSKKWDGNCWMNPPFGRDLKKWVKKAYSETYIVTQKDIFTSGSSYINGTKVCLLPVRSNTKWWSEIIMDSEVRFINGEVNFSNKKRGLWLPMCIVIFGEKAKIGKFSVINYREGIKINLCQARPNNT